MRLSAELGALLTAGLPSIKPCACKLIARMASGAQRSLDALMRSKVVILSASLEASPDLFRPFFVNGSIRRGGNLARVLTELGEYLGAKGR